MIFKLLQEIEGKETHPNWFFEASITLLPESDEDIKRKS